MSQQTVTFHNTTNTSASWKALWRLDAVGNMIAGDLMLFAAGTITEAMGMTENAIWPVRILGVVVALYGLWQMWAAHSGSISRRSYLLAAVDMDILGLALVGALVAGVEFNTTGTVVTIGLAGLVWAFAIAWWVAWKQAD